VAKNINIETIELKLKGFDKLKFVGQTFEKLNKSLSFTPKQLNETIKSVTNFDKRFKDANGTATRSVNVYKQQIAALKELQANVAIGGKAYKSFGAEAKRLKAELEALTKTQKKQKGFFSGIGKGFKAGGATALTGAVGRFLPAGAQIGGAAGFAKTGTIGGAVAGAGVGLAVEGVAAGVGYAKEAAVYASEIEKLRIALKGVTKDQETFEKGLAVISETSKKLNVPIAASTRQFTTLSASVLGAGGTIEDAETVFTGVSNAIKATGGNAEDVQSAIRAMSQIFGKGKVSAEELQGQLGERLAGAVVKFAEANGSSLQKLQKDLRDGTVGLDQVITFAKKLNVDFGATAEKVANSSADAGQRLKVQMDDLKLAVGQAVLPIGAAFQQMFADIVSGITQNQGAMDAIIATFKTIGVIAFSTIAAIRFLTRTFIDLAKILYHIANLEFGKAFKVAQKGLEDTRENLKDDVKSLANMSGIDIFGVNQKPVELPATYKVMGVTYDAKTGAAIPESKGLATLTGDEGKNEIAKISKGTKLLQQQKRLLALKKVEDKFEKQILKRKQDAVIEAEKINQMEVGEGKDTTEAQKALLLANNEKLLQQDIAKIISEQGEAQRGKELSLAKIKQELGLIGKKEVQNLEIQQRAADIYKQIGGDANDLNLTLEKIQELLTGVKTKESTFKEDFNELYKSVTDVRGQLEDLAIQGLDKLGDAFADFVMTGKASFKELAASIISDIGRIVAKSIFLKAITNIIPGLGNLLDSAKGNVIEKGKVKGSAKGNVFAENKIVPYSRGGIVNSIVNKPTLFPMANGMGLMGEAGPEAIMPLKRGSDGKLGVVAQGGGSTIVNVSVDATGSSVEGDNESGQQFGEAIATAIQLEIVKQKRSGGLLA